MAEDQMNCPNSACVPTEKEPLSLDFLAKILIIAPVCVGIIYHTYDIAVANPNLETTRQAGLIFILIEAGVVFWAFRRGYQPLDDVRALSPFLRSMLLLFLATFWVSSVTRERGEPPIGGVQFAYNVMIVIHLLFCGAIAYSVRRLDTVRIRRFATWMGIGALIFAILTAVQFLSRPLPVPLPEQLEWQYAIPGYISVRLFGAYYGALLLLFCTQLLADEKNLEANGMQYFWMILVAAMTIWSGTRAAILALVLVLPFVAIAYGIWPTRKVIIKFSVCFCIASIVAWLLIPPGDSQFYLFMPDDYDTVSRGASGRDRIWGTVLREFLDTPLFGAGPFSSGWVLAKEGMFPQIQPHNAIVQFLIHWGVMGTIPVVIMLTAATWSAHRIAFSCRAVVPIVAVIDALLIMSMFDGTLHFARHLMLVMVCYGVIFAAGRVNDLPQRKAMIDAVSPQHADHIVR